MSDDTNPPQAPPAAPPPIAPADAAVIQFAEGAVAQAKVAHTETLREREQATAQAAALRAEVERLKALVPDAAQLEEIKHFMQRDRHAARLDVLKRMGFDAPLGDSQILALAPDVDPREPDGLAKFEAFRQANPRMFRPAGPSQESITEAVRVELGQDFEKKTGGLFSADKLVKSIFGGGR
jgi:hypothetical protein